MTYASTTIGKGVARVALALLAVLMSARTGGALLVIEDPAPGVVSFAWTLAGMGPNLVAARPTGNGGGTAYLLDGTTGAVLQTFAYPNVGTGNVTAAIVGGNVAIGIPTAPGGGQVYVFDPGTGAALLVIPNPDPGRPSFGSALAALGGNVIVGASGDGTNGRAYLFDGVTGALLQTFTDPNAGTLTRFPTAVAALGTDVLVGAVLGEATHIGAVYRFDSGSGALVQTYPNPTPVDNNAFGNALATLGGEILVGAPGADGKGAAFLLDATSGNVIRTFVSPKRTTEGFGFTVELADVAGTHLALIGPDSAAGLAAAWLFDVDTGNLLGTFRSVDPGSGGRALVEDRVAVGSPLLELVLVFDDADAPGDRYMCDGATVDTRAGGVRLNPLPVRTLADRYGSRTCTIKKERMSCPPAVVNAGPSPAHPATAQQSYTLSCPPGPAIAAESVAVYDELHPTGILVQMIRPYSLLVPSGFSNLGPTPPSPPQTVPPAPPANSVDHFLCYKVRVLAGTPPTIPVAVSDVFYPGGYPGLTVAKLKEICTPVNKANEDPSAPGHKGHLACYQARLAPGVHFTRSSVSTNNLNFGAQVLRATRAGELCLPAFLP